MYILIKEQAPLGLAVVTSAHASLACYLKFKDTVEVTEWLAGTFHKVTCKVSDAEFEAAKAFPDSVVLTESAWEGKEIAIAFKPRAEWPKAFNFYKLYREPKYTKNTPRIQDLQGKSEAYYWVQGGLFNRPQVVLVNLGSRLENLKVINELNFTFHGNYPAHIKAGELKNWPGLHNLEWSGPISEPGS